MDTNELMTRIERQLASFAHVSRAFRLSDRTLATAAHYRTLLRYRAINRPADYDAQLKTAHANLSGFLSGFRVKQSGNRVTVTRKTR